MQLVPNSYLTTLIVVTIPSSKKKKNEKNVFVVKSFTENKSEVIHLSCHNTDNEETLSSLVFDH